MKKYLAAVLGALLWMAALVPAAGAEGSVVYPSSQTILLNGSSRELHAYARMDFNGFLTNYVKVRDLAALLTATTARFDVTWEGAVVITPGRSYRSPNGQENQAPYSGQQPYLPAIADTMIGGQRVNLDAFVIYDESGNGSTYYKLRDLAKVLDFYVTWTDGQGMLMDTSIPYRE